MTLKPIKINETTFEVSDYNFNTMLRNTIPLILPLEVKLEKNIKYSVRVDKDRYFVFSAYLLDEKIKVLSEIDDWMLFLITGENTIKFALSYLRVYGFNDPSEVVRLVILSREKVLHR